MSQKHWLVLLALIGVLFCVSYLYLANKFCPAEQSSPNLNWRLTPDLNKNEKHERAAYRYGRQKNKGHSVPAAFPTAYTLSQKPEAGKDADYAENKGHIWLTKFFCDTKLSDLLIALFTYGLFLATGWLVWATLKLWKAGDEQLKFVRESSAEQVANMLASIDAAKESADSMRRQADAIITSERPYIFLKITDPGVSVESNGEMVFVGKKLKYKFVNYGRTPALLDEIKEHFCVVEGITDGPKPIDPMQDRGRLVPIGTASVNDAPHVQSVNLFFHTADAGAVKMMKPKASEERRICFTGYVRYRDAFGTHYINGFLAIFNAGGGAWVLRGGDEYNYSRTERPEDIPPHPDYAADARRPHGAAP
jgi:hypothetical protein